MTPASSKRNRRLSIRRLRDLADAAGFDGVHGLARHLGRNRVTIYKALRFPSQYGPTITAIEHALGIHEN